jgi:diaminopimelate epimerase
VRALCDRRTGIGADGVLRIARGERHEFFMDYRNADGSLAQMCGNGIRVMARYLETEGLLRGTTVIETRGGDRRVTVESDGQIRVEMGVAEPPLLRAAPLVSVAGRTFPAVAVSVPNPHAVVFVDDLDEAGDLQEAPELAPAAMFPEGANVEFVVVEAPGHARMRVFERGVGETQSCGTGACAAAWAARRATDPPGPAEWIVDVPGGRLRVIEHDSGEIELIGPAVLTASGELPAGAVSSGGA